MWAPRWFRDARLRSAADLISVASGATAIADLTLPQQGQVSGVLRSSNGTIVVGGCVDAVNSDGWVARSVRSSHRGTYYVGGLAADRYRVTVRPCDRARFTARTLEDVIVTEAATTSLDIEVDEPAYIDGTVTGNGHAVKDICALAKSPGSDVTVSSAATNASGTYRIPIEAGTWTVQFVPCIADVSWWWTPEWFDDVTNQSAARQLTLSSAQVVRADAQLKVLGHARGRITLNGETATGTCFREHDARSGAHNEWGRNAFDGWWSLQSMPAGPYKLEFWDCSGATRFERQWHTAKSSFATADTIEVVGETTTVVPDIALVPAPASSATTPQSTATTQPTTTTTTAPNATTTTSQPTSATSSTSTTVGGATTTTTTAGTTSTTPTSSNSTTTTTPSSSPASPSRGVARVAGGDRIATAVLASQRLFASASGVGASDVGRIAARSVVIANAHSFADALVGAPLASSRAAPLLLTPGDRLEARVEAELTRVLPRSTRVYVLGGRSAISDAVQQRLMELGYVVARLSGADRYETSLRVADELGASDAFLLATGLDFPDALGAGAGAAAARGAVILTHGRQLTPAVASFLARFPGARRYAVGGAAAGADPAAVPIIGRDRYETAQLVAERFFEAPASVAIVSGVAFADALTGGASAAVRGAPLLLSEPTVLPRGVAEYLRARRDRTVGALLFGGANALAPSVEAAAREALG